MSPIDRLAPWAVRYAIGRRTYVVADVVETLLANLTALSPSTRLRILDDIERAFRLGDAGDDMDRREWERLQAALALPHGGGEGPGS